MQYWGKAEKDDSPAVKVYIRFKLTLVSATQKLGTTLLTRQMRTRSAAWHSAFAVFTTRTAVFIRARMTRLRANLAAARVRARIGTWTPARRTRIVSMAGLVA